MKKILVWLLVAAVLVNVFVVGAVAQGESESEQATYVEILDCESADGFTSQAEIAVDTKDFTQGAASLSFTVSIPKEANETGSIEATFAPIDVTYATVLEFDFYISNPALLYSTYIMTIDLGSSGNADAQVLDWPSTAFDSITEAGWYHITLPFDQAISMGFDASHLNYFRLLFMNIYPESDLNDVVLKLDNVRVRIPTQTTLTMDTCDFLNEGDWSNWMNNPVTRDPINRTEGTASLNFGFIYTEQYNGWSLVSQKLYAPINATGAVYLEMDVYVSDVALMSHSQYGSGGINIEITSSGECDWNEYSWSLCNYVTENGWTHIRLPIAEAMTPGVERGAPDMSAINYLRFHILGVYGGSIEFRVDNIFFTVMQESETPFYGATPIIREDPEQPGDEGGEEPGETDPGVTDPGQQNPNVTPPSGEQPSPDNDSALRAEQTNRRAKILLLVMIFAIVGIDIVVVAVRRRNEQTVVADGELPPDMPQDKGDA